MKSLAMALVAIAASAAATEPGLKPLSSAFQAASELSAPVSKRLKLVSDDKKEAMPPPRQGAVQEFRLEYGGFQGRRWRLVPDTNPPGSELTIHVRQGLRARLTLVRVPIPGRRPDPDTSFDIDRLEATVDGEASQGVHILFRGGGVEEHVVEFTAQEQGIYPIYNRWSSNPGSFGKLVVYSVTHQ